MRRIFRAPDTEPGSKRLSGLSPEKAFTMHDAVIQALEHAPLLPETMIRLMEIIGNPRAEPGMLVRIVEEDPGLALQALHLCNSAYYSLPVEVTSIHHAVLLLGRETVAGIAMAAYLHGLIDSLARCRSSNLWLQGAKDHFLDVARAAQRLAAKAVDLGVPTGTAFTAGLLHDVGKLVLARLPEAMELRVRDLMERLDLPLVQAEEEALGAHHASVGFQLAERWGIPEVAADAILHHHDPLRSETAVGLLVYLADRAVRALDEPGLIDGSFQEPADGWVLNECGFSRDEVVAFTRQWAHAAGKPLP